MASPDTKQDGHSAAKLNDVGAASGMNPKAPWSRVLSKSITFLKTVISDPVLRRSRTRKTSVPNVVVAKRASCATNSQRYLKIRIMTWNMSNTLPHGDLGELLGTIPPYVQCPTGQINPMDVPNMTEEDKHPYHVVVIAGQECPTVSGFPLGIGAGIIHRDKNSHKSMENHLRNGKEKDDKENENENENASGIVSYDVDYESVLNSNPQSPNAAHIHFDRQRTSGWSWILDQWYCHGRGQHFGNTKCKCASDIFHSRQTDLFSAVDPNSPRISSLSQTDITDEGPNSTSEDKVEDVFENMSQLGPYELLAKKRLMGIYMAIFIYRDIRPLIRGLSKSAVSTGLIGGRVGNKGAIGMSLDLDGTTLLFVNAHLAAHEGRVRDRLANWAKIKAELYLDTFLKPGDPRHNAKDLTEKFDNTFLFGDLNFRLNVSRQQADWLISHEEYNQALAFDQLRNLMAKETAFNGFHEAPIRFPPTYKYDIPRFRDHTGSCIFTKLSNLSLMTGTPEVEEEEAANEAVLPLADTPMNMPQLLPNSNYHDDATSIVSASINPMAASINALSSNVQNDEVSDDVSHHAKSRTSKSDKTLTTDLLNVGHDTCMDRILSKRKSKWKRFVRQTKRLFGHSSEMHAKKSRNKLLQRESAFKCKARSDLEPSMSRAWAKSRTNLMLTSTTRSAMQARHSKHVTEGVYDTSSKQRVPSWCDRILWKSTVSPSDQDGSSVARGNLRSIFSTDRMFQFFSQVLRRPMAPTYMATSSYSSSSSESGEAEDRGFANAAESHQQRGPSQRARFSVGISKPTKRKDRGSASSGQDKRKATVSFETPKRIGTFSSVASRLTKTSRTDQHQPKDSSQTRSATRTWRFFPNYYQDSESSNSDAERIKDATTSKHGQPDKISSPPQRKKGEVVVLQYRTLDDSAMQDLEGRSDHRPVIGSYAIYL